MTTRLVHDPYAWEGRILAFTGLFVASLFAIMIFSIVIAPPAYCSWCVPTFCATSDACPGNCVCAIPFGDITGHCAGTQ